MAQEKLALKRYINDTISRYTEILLSNSSSRQEKVLASTIIEILKNIEKICIERNKF